MPTTRHRGLLEAEARPSPETAIETVTPETARRWLAANYGNRELTPSHAEVLTRAMQRGEWGLGWDAIVFDIDGRLLNGQHRLAGVALSGAAQTFIIARGWPRNAAEWNDHGKKRTLAEILHMRGEPDWRNLAAAIKFTWYYMRHESFQPSKVGPTVQEQLALWERHKGLLPALRRTRNLDRKGKGSPITVTPGTALLYLLGHVDAGDADTFFDLLAKGTGLAEGDPILALRGQLQQAKLAEARNEYKVVPYVKAAWAVLAWNAWQDGVPVGKLAWKFTDPYPKVAGLDISAVDPVLASQTEPPRPPKISVDDLLIAPDN